MLKVIVCSSILMLFIYGYQSFLYSLFDTSFILGAIVCIVLMGLTFLIAAAIDRRGIVRR